MNFKKWKVLKNWLAYKSFRAFGFPKIMPLSYILIATHACYSKCKTCNIWKIAIEDMQQIKDELTLEEWEKVLHSIGDTPLWITVSGGNQFVRKDFHELVKAVIRIAKPLVVNIPVSGLSPNIVLNKMKDILEYAKNTDTKIITNVSLDGIGEQQDFIRGTKGDYENTMKTYNGLKELQKEYKNLSVGNYTVVSSFNVEDIPKIYEHVEKELKPDSYSVEIAEPRYEFKVEEDIIPGVKKYTDTIQWVIEKEKDSEINKAMKEKNALRRQYYELMQEAVKRNEEVIPCYAGVASVQISNRGEVWTCGSKPLEMGNLREAEYDFRKIWKSKKADLARKRIKDIKCHCTHGNVYYSNMLFSSKTLPGIASKMIK